MNSSPANSQVNRCSACPESKLFHFTRFSQTHTRRNGGADFHFSSNTHPLGKKIGFEFTPAPDRQYAWFGFWALARSEPQIERLNHALYEEIVAYLGGQIADVAARRGREVDAAAAGRGLAAMMEGAWVHNIIGVKGMTVPEAQRLSLDYVARLLGGELASESD